MSLAIVVLILLGTILLRSRTIELAVFKDEKISVSPYQSPFGYTLEYSPNDNCVDDISDNWNPGCPRRMSVFL